MIKEKWVILRSCKKYRYPSINKKILYVQFCYWFIYTALWNKENSLYYHMRLEWWCNVLHVWNFSHVGICWQKHKDISTALLIMLKLLRKDMKLLHHHVNCVKCGFDNVLCIIVSAVFQWPIYPWQSEQPIQEALMAIIKFKTMDINIVYYLCAACEGLSWMRCINFLNISHWSETVLQSENHMLSLIEHSNPYHTEAI